MSGNAITLTNYKLESCNWYRFAHFEVLHKTTKAKFKNSSLNISEKLLKNSGNTIISYKATIGIIWHI
jgi:hypothetical protein